MTKRAKKAVNIITACNTPFAQSTKGMKFNNMFYIVFGYNIGKNTNINYNSY